METPSRWRRIADSPTSIFITTYGAGFIAGAVGLAALWEFFTGEKFPQFLTRMGWEITMPSWYYSFVIILFCLVVMLQVKLTQVVLARRRDLGWLEDLARSDDEEMPNIVRFEDRNISVDLYPNPYDPHLIFRVPIFNGSIYDLTLEEKVEGQFRIQVTEGLTPLHDEPKVDHTPDMPKHIEVRRARYFEVWIHQRITGPMLDYIQSKEKVEFWTDSICLQFTYHSYTGTRKTLHKKITGTRIRFPKVKQC